MGTIRTINVVKGKTLIGAVIGFFEVLIWFLIVKDALNTELTGILNKAILKLPQRYRSVFVLKDIDGLSNQEVSSLLDLSMPAVKSRLHRARIMLQKKLNPCYKDYVGVNPLRQVNAYESY